MTDETEKKPLSDPETIETLQNQLADAHDLYLRALAETQNTKHRAELDIQRKSQLILENFAKDLLPVLDNFERALMLADSEKASDDFKNFLVGIEITYKDLLKAVEKNGIEAIHQIGVDFDPTKHHAIDFKTGHAQKVLEIKQAGYVLNGKVLRAALVIVGKE